MNKKESNVSDLNLDKEELKVINFLKEYDVPAASKNEIHEFCDTAGTYLPQRPVSVWELRFWKIVFFEMTGKSPLFWMCCAVILSIGAALMQTAMSYFSPLMVMILSAPVPFIAFIIDALHYRDPNVVELEMTCRYDVSQLYVAKLLIAMLFNIVIILPVAFAANSVYLDGWRLILCVFTTMFFIGFIALMLIGEAKNSLPLSAFLALWIITGAVVLRQPEVVELFENISIAALAIAFGFSLVLFTIKLIYAAQHMHLCAKTGGCNL